VTWRQNGGAMFRLTCWAALTTAALLAQVPAAEQVVDICDVARLAEQYQGKILTVTGYIFRGPHGVTIADEHCRFRNRYRVFGRGAVADVSFYDIDAAPPNDNPEIVDSNSIRNLYAALDRVVVHAGQNSPTVRVTITGRVKIAQHFSVKKLRDGSAEGTGYGFMGRYPIQVVVLSVKKFAITWP